MSPARFMIRWAMSAAGDIAICAPADTIDGAFHDAALPGAPIDEQSVAAASHAMRPPMN